MSFHAEFQLYGLRFPVLKCSFEFQQSTDARGRAYSKVRHGPLELLLDIPDSEFLLEWAAAVSKPLAGSVVFFDNAQASVPVESISFEAGECVHYQEAFEAGDTGVGAYICRITIAASAFTLHNGGPSAAALVAGIASASAYEPSLTAVPSASPAAEPPPSPQPNYTTVSMDPDYEGEETGAIWGTKVQYLSAAERKAYELQVGKDGLLYDATQNIFDTRNAGTVTGKGKAIFVMSAAGEIYASTKQQAGIFHHSSFLSGKPVAAAGEIEVVDGVVTMASNRSGHYTPDQSFTYQFVEQLWRKGAKGTDAINIVDFDH